MMLRFPMDQFPIYNFNKHPKIVHFSANNKCKMNITQYIKLSNSITQQNQKSKHKYFSGTPDLCTLCNPLANFIVAKAIHGVVQNSADLKSLLYECKRNCTVIDLCECKLHLTFYLRYFKIATKNRLWPNTM